MSEVHSTVSYRPISGFPGYRVGDDGSVWFAWITCRSGRQLTDRWKLMKQGTHRKGYRYVNLTPAEGGKYQTFRVHRLVLESFVGPCPEGMECRHFPDTDKSNNRLGNLSWGTREQNRDDNVAVGAYSNRPRNRMHTHQGKTLSVKEWSRHLHVSYNCLYQRLYICGMTFEEAIAKPFLGLAGNGKGIKKPMP